MLAGSLSAQRPARRGTKRSIPPPPPAQASARPIIPTPRSILGFDPGDDRKLVEWPVLVRYFDALARASDRVDIKELGKTIVLITSSIHSTEVGGHLSPVALAYRLATDTGATTRAILDNVIVWLVPSLNPDGVTIVAKWYNRTLGTSAEGTEPPELYHHYAGHDNNRDWYAFTQVETQLTVDSLYNVWHPQIVHDIHQMDANGARLFLPPYLD